MISAKLFIESARELGFEFYTGVPCSYLKPFINYVIDSPDLHYIGASNEGDALAIASGATLCGKQSVVIFQNSGLGNAVNPLTSLNAISKIPVLVITTLRADPTGPADEPQHQLMGKITTKMLELMEIPWEFFPAEEPAVGAALQRAVSHMKEHKTPYALVMKKDSVATHDLQSKPQPKPLATQNLATSFSWPKERPARSEILECIQKSIGPRDVVVATTGHTSRELYAIQDKPNQFYMVGSMGCASSFALGMALADPSRRFVAVEGDGAGLMRLGAWATIGYERPKNLLHLLIDNEVHESTGGQSTVSHSIDFAGVAASCGYQKVTRVTSVDDLKNIFSKPAEALEFAHIKVNSQILKNLPRPTVTPAQVSERLKNWMLET